MTTPANPTDTTTTDATITTDAADTQTTPPTEPANPNSEAARYRTQLRAAETERDALAERVTGYQRRDCERVLEDVLEVPADLFDIGQATLADFFDDDGNVREDELRAAAAALLDQRPRLAKTTRIAPEPSSWGQGSGKRTPAKSGWKDVVGGR